MAGVRFVGVDKRYGAVEAVRGLDLEVADGELMVIVGPSGSGKTTALRMLAGLESITAGEVLIGDRVVNRVAPRERDIAMVFQDYALYPQMSVSDNLAFGLRRRKVPKGEIAARVQRAAELLDIGQLLERKPGQLSGGQAQRVALGRALVREPQVFLMDEPLSNLDAKLRVQMRAEILRLQQELGVTTVYVTHDQVEAMTMGDRVAVLRKGKLQQVAAPQVLYEDPVNLVVGGFIGSPAMNLVVGTVDEEDGTLFATFGSTRLRLDDKVGDERPALRRRLGQRLVIGIRPEDMDDAAVHPDAPDDQRIRAAASLVESLGAETLVHFEVDAPPVVTEDTKELAADAGAEVVGDFVARVTARSGVRAGDSIELAVDTERLHFFDLASGQAVRGEHNGRDEP